ncbi:MAG: hypothetical protein Q8R36_03085 [bacterium]|nr:hypothetical protein [bacterium]
MFNIIAKLQRQPVHIRKYAAFFISGFIAFIIGAIWIATFDSPASPILEETNITVENNLAPLSLLKDQFSQIKSLFSE